MTPEINPTNLDPEAIALAACYRLLLQKAKQRRERLDKSSDSAKNKKETEQLDVQDGNGHIDD